MTIRKKTLLFIGLTLFGVIVVSYAVSVRILLPPFARLEEEDARQHVGRVLEGISESVSILKSKAEDWALLHHPEDLMGSASPQNTRDNILQTALNQMEINLLLLIAPSGSPVFSKAFDLTNREELSMPAFFQDASFLEKLFPNLYQNTGTATGLLLLPEGPLWITSHPITGSTEPHLEGARVVMGKYFDTAEITRLGKRLNLTLSAHRLDTAGLSPRLKTVAHALGNSSNIMVQPLNEDWIAGFTLLRDIHGNPALLLQTDLPRALYGQGKATVQLLLFALLAIGILAGLTIIFLLEKWVLLPLTALCANLKEIASSADLRTRVPSKGKDELSRVATAFNGVLDALENSQRGLQTVCNELEARVHARTEELLKSNETLQTEISERKLAEEALRKSEERLNLVLHGSRDGFWDWNVQTGEVHYDACYVGMLGYTPEELEPNVSFWQDRVHPEDLPSVSRQLDGHFSGATEYYEAEQRLKTRWGEWKWFLDRGKVVERDPNGAPLRAAGTLTDISERKRMEEELIRAKKLEAAGILAGGIAHDFNNLLAVILGNVNMLQQHTGLDAPCVKLLADAEKAALRASDLTKRFITFATGGTPLKRVTSVEKVIQDAVSLACSGTNVQCRYSLSDDLWKVEIDEGQVSQAVYNMILNAREAMPSGGIVSITGENIDAGSVGAPAAIHVKTGRYVRISIHDKGVGIDEAHKDKIFDPYFSTKNKGAQKGMGLGLAIAHSIINKHEGYIVVESQMGSGSTFQIYLPAFRMALPEKDVPGNGRHASRILLMDDEKLMRDMVGQMLLHLGYDVEVAVDGSEAIEIYCRAQESGNPFHGVILDLTVKGGMGGLEALKALKQYDPRTKAIVSSGYSQDPVIAHFKDYGFYGAIGKPYSLEKLKRVLNGVLEQTMHE